MALAMGQRGLGCYDVNSMLQRLLGTIPGKFLLVHSWRCGVVALNLIPGNDIAYRVCGFVFRCLLKWPF